MKSITVTILASILLVLISCGRAENSDFAAATDSTSVTGLTGEAFKLVKTASINCKVKDVHQSLRSISEIAHANGGMISHQNIISSEGQPKELKVSDDSILVISSYSTNGEITARIPAQNLEAFLFKVSEQASFIASSQLDITDKSLEYLSQKLKQESRDKLLAEVTTTKVKDVASLINQKDESIGQEIANRQLDAEAKYSTVQLTLFQNASIKKEVIANYKLADYQLPFFKDLSEAMKQGFGYFLSLVIAISHLWVFILIALLGLLGWKYKSKKVIS